MKRLHMWSIAFEDITNRYDTFETHSPCSDSERQKTVDFMMLKTTGTELFSGKISVPRARRRLRSLRGGTAVSSNKKIPVFQGLNTTGFQVVNIVNDSCV
ncbi:hypothetical protein [Gimesia aquarii]|uniref:Uncharacterized protein n=1 Tax=Gimesia aquarii TaxID=2527964 RepID=A0A517WS18_9PLAN|nr:hypothetical protein [Gimesia aquarii]QDU08051.1 hypothetical protein V202x_14140 [Gimesia aquarii]